MIEPRFDADEFRRVEALFDDACALPAEERDLFLQDRCPDPTLRAQVKALLAHDSSPDDPIQRGIAKEAAAAVSGEHLQAPKHIGRYTITDVLGRGGMGVVYRAEQENPQRTVALKVIQPGLMNERALRRFEFEAQVLGLLQHPYVAQIYEAGTADSAGGEPIPYFAMELVDGEPIDQAVRRRRLGLRATLDLIALVCDAVAHAHQKGIIHRDLKPANILIVEDGSPKVLDFGVARESGEERGTLATEAGQLLGTLPYMSPEQVAEKGLDTRTDVYSLGVLLYELLTGKLPIDVGTRPVVEAARMIVETEPTRISTVDLRFRGDVETIIGKALEKNPDRRYGSAAELAADLRRFLQHEPIAARPASRIYQLTRFARRHRTLVIGVAASFLMLLLAVAAERRQRLHAEEAKLAAEVSRSKAESARAEAESALDGSNRVTRFLSDLLSAASPTSDSGRNVTIREKLVEATARLEIEFADKPLIQARILNTIAENYLTLGEFDRARQMFERIIALRTEHEGPDHASTLHSQIGLANALVHLGRVEDGLALAESTHSKLERLVGAGNRKTLGALAVLSVAHDQLNHRERARDLLETHVSLAREHYGDRHEATLLARNNLAMHYQRHGRSVEAEQQLREVLLARRELQGDEHPDTLTSSNNLGYLLIGQGRYTEAIPHFEAAVFPARRVLGPEHARTVMFGNNLGVSYYAVGRFEDARPYFETAVEVSAEKLGAEHTQTLLARANLAGLHRRLGDLDRALDEYPEIIEAHRRALPPGHPQIAQTLRLHAICLIDAKRYAEAETLLTEAYEALRTSGHPLTKKVAETFTKLYEAWSKPEEAQRWRERIGS